MNTHKCAFMENWKKIILKWASSCMVLITYATSKGSGAFAQSRQSLCCSHTWSMEADQGAVRPKLRYLWMDAHARLKNQFMEDKKYHNLMSWLKLSSNTTLPVCLEQTVTTSNLTLICLVDFSILINWTSPFSVLGVYGVLFHFLFYFL